jgi:hypothetical protein
MKIFLSHSSSDKDIVEKVYKELGAGICHYDVATFDPTGFLPNQIYSALEESTHFVLFASRKALDSSWVQGELKNLFINWMRSKTTTVMVFLLRDGDRSSVPDWLKNYVITEHPTPTHIACRILSEYDCWQNNESNIPPFYRSNESTNLETRLIVEAAKMPTCLLISGLDGFGRKELINEVFKRHFRNVSHRKIHIYTENFDSDVDFYKSLRGLFSLTTAREFVDTVNSYKELTLDQRLSELVELIQLLCEGSQTIILEASDSSILDDSGEINDWIEQLIIKLPSTSYPCLNITTNRKPNYVKSYILEKTVVYHLEPLPTQESSLLFQWWLNKLEVSLSTPIKELVLEQVTGNPKLIESSIRLLKNIPDVSDIGNIKKNVFSDLERNASKLIINIASDDLSKLTLSLIADCGSIAISDLLIVVKQVTNQNEESIRNCYKKLRSYGLIQSDDICIKVPNFLIRTAKSLGKVEPIATQLKDCWKTLAESMGEISCNDETSFTILNEACILKLKSGINSIVGIESLILPSQCLRTARQLYDNNEYGRAYELGHRAFIARLALTDDGAIEALRYCGMSAARLNNSDLLAETKTNFKEYLTNKRAKRIYEFIQGFNFRLAGEFDKALNHMQEAVQLKGGEQDFHVLRELAFLYLSTNEPQKAKIYINKAAATARNNSFILEMQILIELALGKGYVIHNEKSISELIDNLEYIEPFSNKKHTLRVRVEYLLTRGDVEEARRLFDGYYKQGSDGIPKNLLEAKLLIAERKFSDAVSLLNKTKKKIFNTQESQRRSTLPMIADLLTQAAGGISISNGIIEYKQNQKYLPSAIQEKTKKELTEQVAYSKYNLSSEERKTLGL